MSRKVVITSFLAVFVLLIFACGNSFASHGKALSTLDQANSAQLQNGSIKWVVVKSTPKAIFDTEYAKAKKLGYTKKSWDAARIKMNWWWKSAKQWQAWLLPNPKARALTDPNALIIPTEKTPSEIVTINVNRLNDHGNTGGSIYGNNSKQFKANLLAEFSPRGFNFNEVGVATTLLGAEMNKGKLIWKPTNKALVVQGPSHLAISYQLDPGWVDPTL